MEGRGACRRWLIVFLLAFKGLLWQLRNWTCGLGITVSAIADKLTPQLNPTPDTPETGREVTGRLVSSREHVWWLLFRMGGIGPTLTSREINQ